MRQQPCEKNNKDWTYFKLLITSHDKIFDDEVRIDTLTWKQWITNALRRTHGLFGESIEYFFLNLDDKIAYIKLNYNDKEVFSSAITSYISNDDLAGKPLAVCVLQITDFLKDLNISKDDKLWHQKEMEELIDNICE
ncbi:hypothetical protein TBLA_0A08790 [Henningerozyma blattae CBS 6284]|uniref:Ribonucleases P/MRP subunit Pop8-like domain-containing protein n=1 Tax=Henningerozyma blattae (strain ATCC 34711 / CBS 6284 / DSM 70876 / NBRC 10599 / NRRL Y-10934 / UCD 77-7) TaxID=1071380 RepID=I2GX16_HENB6|nr:hypothetical protein TBLA_0A08790 [Tetrapisispora blattae CBS 6284]CCH58668.1 hypothetical protein TBLA_0A08790 [Tetrapisispora blattae CBS 6284]